MPRGQYDRTALRVVEKPSKPLIQEVQNDEIEDGFTKTELKDEIVRLRKHTEDQANRQRMMLNELAIAQSDIKLLEDRCALYERLLDKWTQE